MTRLTGKKPTQAIKEKSVSSKPSTPYSRPVGVNEKKLPPRVNARYLYQPGELEGSGRRATDPIWSLKVYNILRVVTKPDEPVVYYLYDGPKRGFVREELMVVPLDTQLPPISLWPYASVWIPSSLIQRFESKGESVVLLRCSP